MRVFLLRGLFTVFVLSAFFIVANAQDSSVKKGDPPYKITTTSKQIRIKSSKTIQHVMLWTKDGNRVAEHKEINANYFTIDPGVAQKNFFLMIGLENGKIYTEKIGLP